MSAFSHSHLEITVETREATLLPTCNWTHTFRHVSFTGSKRLADIVKQAQALIPEAVKLPAKVPKAVKSAGLKPASIPKIVGAVRNNVKITRKIPKEAKTLIKSSVESLKTVSSALK